MTSVRSRSGGRAADELRPVTIEPGFVRTATGSALISCVRPPIRPLTDSRSLRVLVARGSIAYSAVTQPRPFPAIQRGTPSSADAVQMTRVSPTLISAEPVAVRTNPGSIETGRCSALVRS